MIIASAIRLNDGSVFVGMRHDSAYLNMLAIKKIDEDDLNKIDFYMRGSEMGFVTDKLVFLDRADAYDEAVVCGQVPKDIRENNERILLESGSSVERTILISEDLWPAKTRQHTMNHFVIVKVKGKTTFELDITVEPS